MKERVSCFASGCENCSEGSYMGKTRMKEDLYFCSAKKQTHKRISAQDCEIFQCKDSSECEFCKECKEGK